ncbi:hypothetical protein ACWCQS_17670 [Streptomyces sp. NPDC002076]
MTVTVVRELGAGTAGEVATGRADLGIATLSGPPPTGPVGGVLPAEPYSLAHPAGHPDRVGFVTTPELAATAAVRDVVRALRSLGAPSPEHPKAQLRAV